MGNRITINGNNNFRSKQWVINCRRADLDNLSVERLNKSHRLCAAHFEDSQFMNFHKDRLIWNAIPTIFDVPNPPPQLELKRKMVKRKVIRQMPVNISTKSTSKTIPEASVQQSYVSDGEVKSRKEIELEGSPIFRPGQQLKQPKKLIKPVSDTG